MRCGPRHVLGLVVVVLAFAPAASTALADPGPTIWVSHDGPATPPTGSSCALPGYNSIQAAVTAAPNGSRINVCPGTYTEQVVIPATKSDLVLRSTRLWQAIIQAPLTIAADALNFKAIVRVAGAQNITLLAFTITGPGPGGCDSLRYGVRVDSNGSANIYGNHITDIRDAPPPPTVSGCQNGVAILVGRQFEATTGRANIVGNVIERYQKNGPTVSNTGSSAYIAANRILGAGSTPTIAQNGIQASAGANAQIEHNFVANHIYAPSALSTGILLFNHGQVRVNDNDVAHNDYGIFAFATALSLSTASTSVMENLVQTSTADGIILDQVKSHSVFDNDSDQNGGPGISVYDNAQSNAIANNDVTRNKDSGILLDVATTNTVRNNHVRNNGTTGQDATHQGDGIRANVGTSQNTIQSNFMKGNVDHDCHDDSAGGATAGTANFWINDVGDTQNKPGLCRPSSDTEDRDDRDQSNQVQMSAGWNPALPWYASNADAAAYTWSDVYSTVDTQGILAVLAELGVPRQRTTAPSAVD